MMNKDQRDRKRFSAPLMWAVRQMVDGEIRQRLDCSTAGSGGLARATASWSSQVSDTTLLHNTSPNVGKLFLSSVEQIDRRLTNSFR